MPLLLTLLLVLLSTGSLTAQPATEVVPQLDQYLDSIRNYPVALRLFFQDMPKGGDLHHHFSGSIYTETFVENALAHDLYIQPETLTVGAAAAGPDWKRLSAWAKEIGEYEVRRRLLRYWSVLDYEPSTGTAYDDFFSSFPRFGVADEGLLEKGLIELKQRALAENVQYLETMLERLRPGGIATAFGRYNGELLRAQAVRDTSLLYPILERLYTELLQGELPQLAADHRRQLEELHAKLALDEPDFRIRFQEYVVRTQAPVTVFAGLAGSFWSAAASELINGINIVAPEHDHLALRDYWLHMHMYRFLRRRFPDEPYSMHAGELVLGLVTPEDLRWHIRGAVEVAGAHRIGHGVDIAYEDDARSLLDTLRRRNIAVEINLSSNEFILGVQGQEHPILLYRTAGIPLVLATDDAGVLRTDLTEQYVLLAQRYPSFSYGDIKRLVYNSINYSFADPKAKAELRAVLDRRFAAFEQRWPQP